MHPDTAATADGDGAPSLPFFAVGRALTPLSAFFSAYDLRPRRDASRGARHFNYRPEAAVPIDQRPYRLFIAV